MRNKKFKILLLTIISLAFFSAGASDVYAADTLELGKMYWHTKFTGYKGQTNLKYIKRSSGSKPIAYCPEFGAEAPDPGVSVSKMNGSCWTTKDKYIAGQIITIGRAMGEAAKPKWSNKKEYAIISAALNAYYSSDTKRSCGKYSVNAKKFNSTVRSIVSEANKYYNNYKTSSKLPPITISWEQVLSNTSSQNYVSKAITISGLNSTNYGSVGASYTTSTVPSYTVTLSASTGTAKLCTNDTGTTGCISNGETITENGTYYLIVSNGGTNGGTASLKINGTNTSTYPSSNRWIKSKAKQKLITLSSKTINRSIPGNASFTYPAPDKYSASIKKVDEYGEVLSGAVLRLFTADTDKGTGNVKEICNTSTAGGGDGSSCKKNDVDPETDGFSNGRYICYSETTTPDGYVKIADHCDEINLGLKKSYWFKTEQETENETEVNEEEYNNASVYTEQRKYFATAEGDAKFQSPTTNYLYKYTIVNSETGATTTEYSTDPNKYDNDDTVTVQNKETLEGELVCKSNSNDTYKTSPLSLCDGKYTYHKVEFTSGNVAISVGNALNSVNISKKAITGDEEIPGATLAIYTATGGKCSSTLATAKGFEYGEFSSSETDSASEDTATTTTDTDETDEGTDEDEADEEGFENETTIEEDTDETTNPASTGLTWISSSTPAIVYGLAAGDYCLKETLPPSGYKLATTEVMFSMDESGNINTTSKDNYDEKSKTLIIRDELTSISISKTDAATTKELPGAQMKICGAEKDENDKYVEVVDDMGICRPVTLEDGNEAEWTSGTTPHIVEGLPAGAYYLIETTAPNGYSTAESILFIVKEDGTLTDANGRSLADNKLEMKDAPIRDVKTGMLTVIITSIICLSAIGIGSYTYLKKLDEPKKTSK